MTIPIYLDTIIRLTQYKSSSDYPSKEIKKICSKDNVEYIEDIVLPDIDTLSEKYISSIEESDINDEDITITYKKGKNDKKTALELLLGDDFEEDFFGGKNSGSSISSEVGDSGSSIASEIGDLGSQEIVIEKKPKESVSSERNSEDKHFPSSVYISN